MACDLGIAGDIRTRDNDARKRSNGSSIVGSLVFVRCTNPSNAPTFCRKEDKHAWSTALLHVVLDGCRATAILSTVLFFIGSLNHTIFYFIVNFSLFGHNSVFLVWSLFL